MREIYQLWNMKKKNTLKPFLDKTTKVLFIVICKHQPTITSIYNHQPIGDKNPHWYKPWKAPTYYS